MKVFVCTDHEGHWPVGVCSIVVAPDEAEARTMLFAELRSHGIHQSQPFTLRELDTSQPRAHVLLSGDY